MEKLKPALTYEEQVCRLKQVHNLSIADDNDAISILKKVNYYRLSGYGIGLMDSRDPEKYIDNISLDWLFSLYCFDSKFKNNLFHIIEQIEIQLRAQIAYQLAIKYGPDGYVLSNNFIQKVDKYGKSYHQLTLEKFQQEVKRQQRVPFVNHHIDKYGGKFPIWVAVELFTFGMLTSLYDIMQPKDQKEISDQYNVNTKNLKSWMLSLVEVRNICAHGTRLYNMPLKQTPYLFKENVQYRHKVNKVFPVLLVIRRILCANEQWKSFFREIDKTISKYDKYICFSFMGFPKNWREILQN